MFRRAIETLRRVFDPRGPAADILSTDSFFKERAGLPYSVGHRQRAELAPLSVEQIERACAPERYAVAGEIDVPYSRERVVSPYIIERYKPVMAGMQIVGWRVVQEPRSQFCDCLHARWSKEGGEMVHTACGRRRAPLTDAEIVEKVMTVQMQPSDAFYDGYYETIPGKDRGVVEGVEVVGGTRIRSRRDYQQKTKGWVHWDRGTPAAVEKALAEEKRKCSAHLDRVIEERAHRLVSDRPGDL